MIPFLPKRLCWFSEVPDGAYESAEPLQKTEPKSQQELAELAKDVEQSKQTPETAQESPEGVSKEIGQKALERDKKNVLAVAKLDGSKPTEGTLKMKLMEKDTLWEYIKQTGHRELKEQLSALQEATRERVKKVAA